MALLSVQAMASAGLQATYGAVSASDTADVSNGHTFLHVKNGGASSDTVTVVTPGTVDGLAITDRTVTVANGTEKFIPLNPATYTDPATGLATITHSYTTSVTCALVTL